MSLLFFERRGSVSRCEINTHFRCWPWMRARQHCLVGARWKLPRRVWHVASVRFFAVDGKDFGLPAKFTHMRRYFALLGKHLGAAVGWLSLSSRPPSSLPRQGGGRRGGFVKRGQPEIPQGVYPRRRSSPRELGWVWSGKGEGGCMWEIIWQSPAHCRMPSTPFLPLLPFPILALPPFFLSCLALGFASARVSGADNSLR